eukprot:TRINITY_DN11394_c0_g1_i3.p1 TRINITY_DN11394_c0_g1~~TRINITY_DN11394_c0_g1_i3.p1  ORF type:complete len:2795 (+),score=677.84 TRINITY_DN11394_c0_g1_i3:765-8387(+)
MDDMWMFECQLDTQGGVVKWGTSVHLRHLVSGQLLSVRRSFRDELRKIDETSDLERGVPPAEGDVLLLYQQDDWKRRVDTPEFAQQATIRRALQDLATEEEGLKPQDPALVWIILPCCSTEQQADVLLSDSFLLQHKQTGYYLHITQTPSVVTKTAAPSILNDSRPQHVSVVRNRTLDDAWYASTAQPRVVKHFWQSHSLLGQLKSALADLADGADSDEHHVWIPKPLTRHTAAVMRDLLGTLVISLEQEAEHVHPLLPFVARALNDIQNMMSYDGAIVVGLRLLAASLSRENRAIDEAERLRTSAFRFLKLIIRDNTEQAVALYTHLLGRHADSATQNAFFHHNDARMFGTLIGMLNASVDICANIFRSNGEFVHSWAAFLLSDDGQLTRKVVKLLRALCLARSLPGKILLSEEEIAYRRRAQRQAQHKLFEFLQDKAHVIPRYTIAMVDIEPEFQLLPTRRGARPPPVVATHEGVQVSTLDNGFLHELFAERGLPDAPDMRERKLAHLALLDLVLGLAKRHNRVNIARLAPLFPLNALVSALTCSDQFQIQEALQVRLLQLVCALHIVVEDDSATNIRPSRIWSTKLDTRVSMLDDPDEVTAPRSDQYEVDEDEESASCKLLNKLRDDLVQRLEKIAHHMIDRKNVEDDEDFTDGKLQVLKARVQVFRRLLQNRHLLPPGPNVNSQRSDFARVMYVCHLLWQSVPPSSARAREGFEGIQYAIIKTFRAAETLLMECRLSVEVDNFRQDMNKEQFAMDSLVGLVTQGPDIELFPPHALSNMWDSAAMASRLHNDAMALLEDDDEMQHSALLNARILLGNMFERNRQRMFDMNLERFIVEGDPRNARPYSIASVGSVDSETAPIMTFSNLTQHATVDSIGYVIRGRVRDCRKQLARACCALIEHATMPKLQRAALKLMLRRQRLHRDTFSRLVNICFVVDDDQWQPVRSQLADLSRAVADVKSIAESYTTLFQPENSALVKKHLQMFRQMCFLEGRGAQKDLQNMCRYYEVHTAALAVLQWPLNVVDDATVYVDAYHFLQAFVMDNSENQLILAPHIALIQSHLTRDLRANDLLLALSTNKQVVAGLDEACITFLCSLLSNTRPRTLLLRNPSIADILQYDEFARVTIADRRTQAFDHIEPSSDVQRRVRTLQLLKRICVVNKKEPMKQHQSTILGYLRANSRQLFSLCSTTAEFQLREKLTAEHAKDSSRETDLCYHYRFVQLLACTATDNVQCQAMCRDIVPFIDVYANLRRQHDNEWEELNQFYDGDIFALPRTLPALAPTSAKVRAAYWQLLRRAYLDAPVTMFDEHEFGFLDEARKNYKLTPFMCKLVSDVTETLATEAFDDDVRNKFIAKNLLPFLSGFIRVFAEERFPDALVAFPLAVWKPVGPRIESTIQRLVDQWAPISQHAVLLAATRELLQTVALGAGIQPCSLPYPLINLAQRTLREHRAPAPTAAVSEELRAHPLTTRLASKWSERLHQLRMRLRKQCVKEHAWLVVHLNSMSKATLRGMLAQSCPVMNKHDSQLLLNILSALQALLRTPVINELMPSRALDIVYQKLDQPTWEQSEGRLFYTVSVDSNANGCELHKLTTADFESCPGQQLPVLVLWARGNEEKQDRFSEFTATDSLERTAHHRSDVDATWSVVNLLSSNNTRIIKKCLAVLALLMSKDGGNEVVQERILGFINDGHDSSENFVRGGRRFQLLEKLQETLQEVVVRSKAAPWWLHANDADACFDDSIVGGHGSLVSRALAFIQQLCEGHNHEAQTLLRVQARTLGSGSVFNINVIATLVHYLEAIVPPYTPDFPYELLDNVIARERRARYYRPINAALKALTETIQGPCVGNQKVLIEGQGLDVLLNILRLNMSIARTSLETGSNDINMDLLFCAQWRDRLRALVHERDLYKNACVLLLALLEGPEHVEHCKVMLAKNLPTILARILNIYGKILTRNSYGFAINKYSSVARIAADDVAASMLADAMVFFQLYTYLTMAMQPSDVEAVGLSTEYRDIYTRHQGRIEVVVNARIECMLFQHDPLMEYITAEDKQQLLVQGVSNKSHTDRIDDFQQRTQVLYETLKLRQTMSSVPWKHMLSSYNTGVLLRISTNLLALIINILIIVFAGLSSGVKDIVFAAALGLGIVTLIFSVASLVSYALLEYRVEQNQLSSSYAWQRRRQTGQQTLRTRISLLLQKWLQWKAVYLSVLILASFLGVTVSLNWFCVHLLDIVFRNKNIQEMFQSVTTNWKQLLLTIGLIVVISYFYGVIGFLFFTQTIVKSAAQPIPLCTSPFWCWVTVVAQFPTSGEFLYDSLVPPLPGTAGGVVGGYLYNLTFFFVVMVLMINILFGIVVDTFIQIRRARQARHSEITTKCFICGLKGTDFDRDGDGFEKHVKDEHNAWHYVSCYVHIRQKEQDDERTNDMTGLETYVQECHKSNNLVFYPLNRARSLDMKQRFDVEEAYEQEKTQKRRREERLYATLRSEVKLLRLRLGNMLRDVQRTVAPSRLSDEHAALLQKKQTVRDIVEDAKAIRSRIYDHENSRVGQTKS